MNPSKRNFNAIFDGFSTANNLLLVQTKAACLQHISAKLCNANRRQREMVSHSMGRIRVFPFHDHKVASVSDIKNNSAHYHLPRGFTSCEKTALVAASSASSSVPEFTGSIMLTLLSKG